MTGFMIRFGDILQRELLYRGLGCLEKGGPVRSFDNSANESLTMESTSRWAVAVTSGRDTDAITGCKRGRTISLSMSTSEPAVGGDKGEIFRRIPGMGSELANFMTQNVELPDTRIRKVIAL